MRRLDPLLVALAVLALWQTLYWTTGEVTLASPAITFQRLAVLAARPAFWTEAGSTAGAFLVAAAISVVAGILLGGILGTGRLAGQVLEPVLASLYALPKVTLYPVVLLLFGLGASAKIAFGIMHGLIPLILVTMNAVSQVRPVYLRTARALRLTRLQLLRTIIWPAIRPEILGGIRICVPLALLGVLIGEMFASRRGLGSMAMRAMETNDVPTVLAIATLLSAAALGINAVLTRVAAGR